MKNGADFSYDALSGLDEMDSFSVCLGVSQGYGVAIFISDSAASLFCYFEGRFLLTELSKVLCCGST